MSVRYKFKSTAEMHSVPIDDIHVSLREFKKAVAEQLKMSKNSHTDFRVINSETNEEYIKDEQMIPRNASLILIRIPLLDGKKKYRDSDENKKSQIDSSFDDFNKESTGLFSKKVDLTHFEGSEGEKIKAMMHQSTADYNPLNYKRVRFGTQFGIPSNKYVCRKCKIPGHWIKDCPISSGEVKRSSGIPLSFMTEVSGPDVPGALLTPLGKYAVPTVDLKAYMCEKMKKPLELGENRKMRPRTVPKEYICAICNELMNEAVTIPCCSHSFCDECVQNALIQSEDRECPRCHTKNVSTDELAPNESLRIAVDKYRSSRDNVVLQLGKAARRSIRVLSASERERLKAAAKSSTLRMNRGGSGECRVVDIKRVKCEGTVVISDDSDSDLEIVSAPEVFPMPMTLQHSTEEVQIDLSDTDSDVEFLDGS